MDQSGVNYRIGVPQLDMSAFDQLIKGVGEATKAIGSMTAQLGHVQAASANAGAAATTGMSGVSAASHSASKSVEEVGSGLEGLTDTLKDVGYAFGIAFSIDKVVEMGKEILHVTAEFQGYENRIKFASGGVADAADNMTFLKHVVTDLHQPIQQVYEGFSQMEAGMKGTEIQGNKLRNLFEGISMVSATTHLSGFEMQHMLYDLKEIGEVGMKSRATKFLPQWIPGIQDVVKKAFGHNLQELEKSGMSGTSFLAKLGPALTDYFKGGLDNYKNSLQASITDTANAQYEEQVKVGERLEGFYKNIMGHMRSFIYAIGDDAIKAIDFVKEHIEGIKEIAKVVGVLAGAYVTYKAAVMGVTAVIKLQAWWEGASALMETILASKTALVALGYDGLTASVLATTAAMEANPMALLITALAAVGFAAYEAYQGIEDMNQAIDQHGDKINWDDRIEKLSKLDLVWKNIEESSMAAGLAMAAAFDVMVGRRELATKEWADAKEHWAVGMSINNQTYGKISGAGGTWEEGPMAKGKSADQVLAGERGGIKTAGEGNHVRNVIVNIAEMIGVKNMTYDHMVHDERKIQRVVSNMIVNATRDSEIALAHD